MSQRSKEDKNEHSYIRFSKAARSYFDAIGKKIEISMADEKFLLEIHHALIQDIIESKKSGVDMSKTGFITQETYNKINNKNPKDIWVSETIEDLNVGSDPEFGLIDAEGSFVYAANLGIDPDKDKPVGTDGPCMELRPPPTCNIEGHIENIRKLIKNGAQLKKISDYRWWTGASFKSPAQPRTFVLGGHIHIGNPTQLASLSTDKQVSPAAAQRVVIRVLNELLGIPLIYVDGPAGKQRKTQYGRFEDFRDQPNRLEWRTPSAVWLTSPTYATAVIGTAKAVAEHCYLLMAGKNFSAKWVSGQGNNSLLNKLECLPTETVKELINTHVTISEEGLTDIIKKLKNLSTYSKYKDCIDTLIRLIKTSSSWKPDFFSIKDNWLVQDKPGL